MQSCRNAVILCSLASRGPLRGPWSCQPSRYKWLRPEGFRAKVEVLEFFFSISSGGEGFLEDLGEFGFDPNLLEFRISLFFICFLRNPCSPMVQPWSKPWLSMASPW